MVGSFSEQATQVWDFVRCVRPNGSHYGTAGKCRLGTEAGAKSQNSQDQKMGIGGELDASEEELEVFYNSGPNNKKILEGLVSNVPAGTRVSIVKREFSEGAYVKTDFTTKSGHLVSTVTASKRFDFQVNEGFDVGTVKNHREGVEVANAVRRTFEALVKALPDGAVLETSAWTEDGHGKNRVRAYEKMGFSPPERTKYGQPVEGQPGDPQFARKESGRMVSSSLSEKNSDQSYNFNEEIVSTILWYVAVFGTKPSFDADYSEVLDFTRCERPNGTHYGTAGKCRKGTESPYDDWEVFAQGAMGTIAKNKDGTRVVKRLKEGRTWGPYEAELGKRMGELGFAPKVHSSGDDHIEMDMLKGKPLWKDFRMDKETESPMNKAQSERAAQSIFTLHKLGFYHGDMHSQQFVANGNNVSLVDYGLSGKAKDNPRKVIQDLNKITSLVNWDNPELDGNKYVQVVRKYRDLYKTAKKKPETENEIASQYLKEIESL